MNLTSETFEHASPLPVQCAFCKPDADTHASFGANRNPALSWTDVPKGAKSLVLICHDPDVPSRADDVNQEGKVVPAELERVDFYHWVLVDISADAVGVQEGEFSDGVTAKGKSGPTGPRGTRQGVNDYTGWFADDEAMAGSYFGYDGPCPPWNDTIVHRYHFTLYAIDVERCPVGGEFTAGDVHAAIEDRVLAQAKLSATYTLSAEAAASSGR